MALGHEDFHILFSKASEIFKKEDAVVRLSSDCAMFVGDIHGNLKALEFVLQMRQELGCKDIIFLGDYVDRGSNSLDVLSRLFELKLREPQHVILLRGNHETMEMNSRYGFSEEVKDHDTFLEANKAFQGMPVAAVINDNIFCVHGGIPQPVDVEDISKENSFPYLWNDPSASNGMNPSPRGMRPQCFGPDIFSQFMTLNNFSLMIRAHTAYFKGYSWWFDNRLLSLFSSPNYTGNKNKASFAFQKEGKLQVFVFGDEE